MEGGHWGRGKGQTADCKETQEVPRHPLFLKHIILNNKNLDKIFLIFNSDRVETQKTEGDTSSLGLWNKCIPNSKNLQKY